MITRVHGSTIDETTPLASKAGVIKIHFKVYTECFHVSVRLLNFKIVRRHLNQKNAPKWLYKCLLYMSGDISESFGQKFGFLELWGFFFTNVCHGTKYKI